MSNLQLLYNSLERQIPLYPAFSTLNFFIQGFMWDLKSYPHPMAMFLHHFAFCGYFRFFSFPSWQASLPLLYLIQLAGTLSVSFRDISSVSVICRPKLSSSSEDIFFCFFFIPFFFKKNHSYSCFTISAICVIR